MPLSHAIGCLIGFGLSVAGILAGGKVMLAQTQMSPLYLASAQYLLSGLVLLVAGWPRQDVWRRAGKSWLFFVISAGCGIAAPQIIVFLVVPHLGAGVTAMMYLFPPLLTYAFALGWRMERFDGLGLAGLSLGLIGGACLFWGQGISGGGAIAWLALAFLAPLSQAGGNIYRTLFWPADIPLVFFTALVLLLSALLPLPIALVLGERLDISGLAPRHWAIWLASAAACFGYLLFFHLQRRNGPVYVSQGGYVIAAFGILAGALFFGERLPALAILGAALVALGIGIYTIRTLKKVAALKSAS